MSTFGQEVKTKPSLSSEKINSLRLSLINEELEELKKAMQEKNNELDQMKEDLDGMKDEMSEIKSLLLSLNQKLNN